MGLFIGQEARRETAFANVGGDTILAIALAGGLRKEGRLAVSGVDVLD